MPEKIFTNQSVQCNASKVIHTSIQTYHQVTFRYTIEYFASIAGLYTSLTGLENDTGDEFLQMDGYKSSYNGNNFVVFQFFIK